MPSFACMPHSLCSPRLPPRQQHCSPRWATREQVACCSLTTGTPSFCCTPAAAPFVCRHASCLITLYASLACYRSLRSPHRQLLAHLARFARVQLAYLTLASLAATRQLFAQLARFARSQAGSARSPVHSCLPELRHPTAARHSVSSAGYICGTGGFIAKSC